MVLQNNNDAFDWLERRKSKVLRLEVFQGGEDLGGRQPELLGDLVVGDHHHLHPRRQPGLHAVWSVLKHQTPPRLGSCGEPAAMRISDD